MIKIAIADDHKMFVDGIDSIINNEDTMKVVGRSYDGPGVLTFLDNNEVDIVLLDVNLPGMNGIEVCKSIKGIMGLRPQLKISPTTKENHGAQRCG